MNESKKSVSMIPWVFFALILVLSIFGVLYISNDITLNYGLNGSNWTASKYFLFLVPLLSFYIGITGGKSGGAGKKKNNSLLFIIFINLVLVGFVLYTIISD